MTHPRYKTTYATCALCQFTEIEEEEEEDDDDMMMMMMVMMMMMMKMEKIAVWPFSVCE